MAEETKNSSSKMALWPSLKKKLVEAKKKKKQKKSNPFASQGLEKFALLMAELQAKKSSLVDKTGNSVSAVRYLSRSAQEWTASTIARTASRGRKDSASHKGSSSEIMLLQQLPDYSSLSKAETATTEAEIVEFSQSFSFRGFPVALHPGHGFDDSEVPLVVGDLQQETDAVETTIREPCEEDTQEVGCSGKKMDMIRTGRLLLLEKGWARSPNSAVALLVALSACAVARVHKIGNSFLEFLTIDLVFRWQRGKLYADFLQSLVTRHIVPHLSVPRGLALLPLIRRNKSKTPPELALNGTPESETECELKQPVDLSFSFPVIVPDQEIVSAEIRTEDLAPAKIRTTSSSTRRLVRKLSSKLKSKMGSPDSSHSVSSRKGSKFSFSRKEKSEVSSDDGWPDDDVFADSASSSKKRSILGKKCSFRKEKTPELPSARRSPLGRNFSMESNTDMITTEPVRNQSVSIDTGCKNFDLWLILGLLVALLFLLVSRLSAIVATSLLFLLLSHAHKETSKYRVPRRSTREPEPSSNEFYRRGQ